LQDIDSVYVAEELSGFTKRLTEDGVVARQVDLLLLGFGFAVRNRIPPPERIRRHDLLRVGALDADTRLSIEAVATWYARELGLPPLEGERSLLDFICRVGSAGLSTLQTHWEGKAKSQIELAILKLGATNGVTGQL
jgi:hypothetical protein